MEIKKEIRRKIVEHVIKCFEKDMKRRADPIEAWIIENSVAITLETIKKKDIT